MIEINITPFKGLTSHFLFDNIDRIIKIFGLSLYILRAALSTELFIKTPDSTKYVIIASITNIGCIQGLYIIDMDCYFLIFLSLVDGLTTSNLLKSILIHILNLGSKIQRRFIHHIPILLLS
jgi:hypothetical protein